MRSRLFTALAALLLAATVGAARAQETDFGKYRGVWAGMKSEAVFTDSVMMYFHRDTLSGTGYGALRVPSRGIDMLTTFAKDTILFGKTPDYRIHATPDGALCIGGDTLKKVENIDIPAYVVASYTNSVHTHGTFAGYRRMASKEKWLRVHNTQEWYDYYTPENVEDLRRFFDHYLKGIDNGWEKTPRVRLSVLNPGGKDIVGRPENEFPLARTQYERLYLSASDSTLQTSLPAKEAVNVYRSEDENHQVTYRYRMDKPTEITGYMKLHLWVAAPDNDDMDLSVSVEKLSKDGKPLPDKTGSLIAATGMMRVSMRQLDEAKSTEAELYYPFTTEQKLKPGEIVPVEIEIWPMGLYFNEGEMLQLTVGAYQPANAAIPFGSASISVPREGYTFMPGQPVDMITVGGNATQCADPTDVVVSPATHNAGRHRIYTGGQYDSYLYVPEIPNGAQAE